MTPTLARRSGSTECRTSPQSVGPREAGRGPSSLHDALDQLPPGVKAWLLLREARIVALERTVAKQSEQIADLITLALGGAQPQPDVRERLRGVSHDPYDLEK